MRSPRAFLLVSLSLLHGVAQAELQVSPMFSDNAVLQQGVAVPVWGWAEDSETVTVQYRGQKVKTKPEYGKWSVTLKKLKYGAPDRLAISTRDKTIVFTNVVVGEVWLCSGQSNMEWPLERSFEPEADIAAATNSLIRYFHVLKNKSDAPTTRINARWQLCAPEVARSSTAVGYYFARALFESKNVPIGLIESDWGGSPIEVWMSRETLEMRSRYIPEILEGYNDTYRKYRDANLAYEIEKAEATKAGEKFDKRGPWQPWKPSELYQGMIAPLIPYALKGAIWYQGESNAGRAEQYRVLFVDMIGNWRRDWGQGDFTFLCVQLAPFKAVQDQPGESDWAELREAQLLATKVLPNVGIAVITDVGDSKDIHPRKKQPVGERLAFAARGIAYGDKIVYSGPIYRSSEINGGKVILHFDHTFSGLEARGGELKGFAICGEDHRFFWAKAEIIGDLVVVTSPEVPNPVAVRYGWADCPEVNLYNRAGFPASPFRTDDFPMITAGKP